MEFGFSHCYHLHLSLFPWDLGSFREKLDKAYDLMRQAGCTSFRPHVHWNRVEPVIQKPDISIDAVSDRMIDDYIRGCTGIFWEETDLIIDRMIAHHIKPFLCLGAAYVHQTPYVETKKGMVKFDSDEIPGELYLGHLYLHARAVVRRYKDRCNHWQLENELNVATPTELFSKWRRGRKWRSAAFRTRLLEGLYRAVKDEDPAALTAHNFATAWPQMPGFGTWQQHIRKWNRYFDIIGFDPFPNYKKGAPIRIMQEAGRLVKIIRGITGDKPLYILEDGYPVAPACDGFSEEGQKAYVAELLDASKQHAIDGLFIYCFTSNEGAPGNEWHKFTMPIQDVEDWWGYFRADGTPRPAYQYLVERMKQPGDNETVGNTISRYFS